MMLKTALTMIAAVTLVSGCAIETATCDWAAPIRPSVGDVLTDGTVQQILVHNETGAELCGWTP